MSVVLVGLKQVHVHPPCGVSLRRYTPVPNPEVKEGRRGYHAVSRGLILNCLLMRVDPKRRTMGQFLAEEIAGPLSADVFCGMPEELQGQHHIADMAPFQMRWSARDPDHKQTLASLDIQRIAVEGSKRDGTTAHMGAADGGVQNSVFSRSIVSPSTNGHASARGLAKIAAAMAAKGSLGGVELMSPETFESAHSHVSQKYRQAFLFILSLPGSQTCLVEQVRRHSARGFPLRAGRVRRVPARRYRPGALRGAGQHHRGLRHAGAGRQLLGLGWGRRLGVHLEPGARVRVRV